MNTDRDIQILVLSKVVVIWVMSMPIVVQYLLHKKNGVCRHAEEALVC